VLSEDERRQAAAMLQRLLALVAADGLHAGGPRGLSLQRRLEGALVALRVELDAEGMTGQVDVPD
jgi:hypothetical protein